LRKLLLVFWSFIGMTFSSNSLASPTPNHCPNTVPVPFTFFLAGHASLHFAETGEYCIIIAEQAYDLGPNIPIHVTRMSEEEYMVAARESVSNLLTIFYVERGVIKPVPLTFEDRSQLHVEALISISNRSFLMSYNVALSLPSGRRVGRIEEGLQLYEISLTEGLTKVPNVLWNAGLEAAVFVEAVRNRTIVCAAQDCSVLSLSDNGELIQSDTLDWNDITGSNIRIQELATDGNVVQALVGRDLDDRFHPWPKSQDAYQFVCNVYPGTGCSSLSADTLHYDLQVNDAGVTLKSVPAIKTLPHCYGVIYHAFAKRELEPSVRTIWKAAFPGARFTI